MDGDFLSLFLSSYLSLLAVVGIPLAIFCVFFYSNLVPLRYFFAYDVALSFLCALLLSKKNLLPFLQ